MSARLVRRVLKEQELAVEQLQLNSDDDSGSPVSVRPSRNLFDLLEDEDDDSTSSVYHHNPERQEKGEIAIETDLDTGLEQSSTKKDALKLKAKSRNKKKKTKENISRSCVNGVRSSDLMLENSSLQASSSDHQPSAPLHTEPAFGNINGNGQMYKKLGRSSGSILQVDPKFLSAENEMRKIFGSRVVKSYERCQASTNVRMVRGGRRGTHHHKKTIIVSPAQHWARWDGSLTMELLDTKDSVHYFRYTHSSSYAQAQRAFEAVKAMNDLNGIANILLHHPYHIDSLLTLADYFKFTGEQQMSADAIAKALYAFECAWHPEFNPVQNCQLKYTHDTNKPFFSSLFAHMKNMDRRGCHRSALEVCKLLLSLDSDDPMGAILCIDYYALRSEEYAWLERFSEEYIHDNSLWLFPNFAYSLAVCRFYLEHDEPVDKKETNNEKATSVDLMMQALMLHPSVLKKLVGKVPLMDRMWNAVLDHSLFRSEKCGSPSLDHLIALYVEKSYLIWRLPDLQKILFESANLVIQSSREGSDAKDWACVRAEVFSSEKNEYSHVLLSDFSDTVATMPPDNLQGFMVNPRGVQENHEAEPPQNRELRDISGRNAFVVLFESILPWVNYRTEDGGHIPHDLDEDNED